jgi:pimeloyl-ACP methyl ester carboxylesterase
VSRKLYENHASRYLTVDGLRIHYRDEGSGPPLVLLHGVMASLHTWDGWVAELQRHYRVLRFDLPGFGFSDDLPGDLYTPEHGARLMELTMRALGLERFHLAGNSLGGFLAWNYAAAYPQRIEKLVLLSPIAFSQRLPGVIDLVSLPGVGELAKRVVPRAIVHANVREVFGNPRAVSPELLARYTYFAQRKAGRRTMVKMFRTLKAYNDDPSITRHLASITAPTLLMWGSSDRWVPPSLLGEWRRHLPHAQIRLYPGLGHTPMEESPAITARDAHGFLST